MSSGNGKHKPAVQLPPELVERLKARDGTFVTTKGRPSEIPVEPLRKAASRYGALIGRGPSFFARENFFLNPLPKVQQVWYKVDTPVTRRKTQGEMKMTKAPAGYNTSWMVFERTAKGWLAQRDQQGQRISANFKTAVSNARLGGHVCANYWDMPADESEWPAHLEDLASKQALKV